MAIGVHRGAYFVKTKSSALAPLMWHWWHAGFANAGPFPNGVNVLDAGLYRNWANPQPSVSGNRFASFT